MRRAPRVRVRWSLAIAALAAVPGARAQEGPWALTNVRIETVTRGVIERGTLVIRNGLIEAVGPNVATPADARVLDLTGRIVYPGIIDLTSALGIPSGGGQQGQGGQGGPGGAAAAAAAAQAPAFVGLEPDRLVADEFRVQVSDVRTVRDGGVTAVLSAPPRGAFRGLSALVPLRDSVTARELVRSPVGLHMGFQGAQGRYPATLFGVMAYERQAFLDARRQAVLLERYRQSPRGMERPANDAKLAALIPVLRGELPVFFAASSENEIRRALGIGREFGLNVIVTGATEGFRALDALQAARRPVVVSVDFPRSPDVTGWAYRSAQRHAPNDSAQADSAARRLIEGNAAALNAAGVRFALASGGSLRSSEFLANVRKAIAAGLPRDTALAALTIRPAEIAGVAQQLGSIEEGKIANLVITEGDLLGDSAKVKAVFVDGVRYEVVAPPAGGTGGRGVAGGAAAAAQIGGTWDVSITTPQGDQNVTMTINQSGSSFTGTMTSPVGSLDITGGSIEGRRASWTVTLNMGGQSMTLSFQGDVEGTRMRGTAQLGDMGAAQFTGEKRTP